MAVNLYKRCLFWFTIITGIACGNSFAVQLGTPQATGNNISESRPMMISENIVIPNGSPDINGCSLLLERPYFLLWDIGSIQKTRAIGCEQGIFLNNRRSVIGRNLQRRNPVRYDGINVQCGGLASVFIPHPEITRTSISGINLPRWCDPRPLVKLQLLFERFSLTVESSPLNIGSRTKTSPETVLSHSPVNKAEQTTNRPMSANRKSYETHPPVSFRPCRPHHLRFPAGKSFNDNSKS
jgi:hypothetical protein